MRRRKWYHLIESVASHYNHPMCVYMCARTFPCACECVYMCVRLRVRVSVCTCVCVHVYMCGCLSLCLSVCLSIRLSVCLSVCVSVWLSSWYDVEFLLTHISSPSPQYLLLSALIASPFLLFFTFIFLSISHSSLLLFVSRLHAIFRRTFSAECCRKRTFFRPKW